MTKYIAIAAIVIMFFSSCENQSPEARFWTWFEENQDEIYHFERDQERVFDRLQEEMSKVHPDLTFEFGPEEDGKREFVISADGIIEAFPAVEALYSSAPSLPRWTIIKFRPRRPAMTIEIGQLKLEPSDIQVSIEPDGEKAGLTVFVKDLDQSRSDQYKQAAFIMLDQAIGEYDMETKVGFIGLQPFESNSDQERHSLDELPQRFDDFLRH
ncbi:MAG: hypothetical protein IPM63_05060 [Acidobacteriota bacterium]|nr:MAG: hypothetical protein IPM63_05060 [Acidobacteriota bacterium]